jgi:ABC-type transport system involved in cytochrome c biogenesis ATPase subunit
LVHVSDSFAVTAPMLNVRDLTIQVGGRDVIRNLSFSASAGSIVWMTGENGAGKSTLLRMLALRSPIASGISYNPVPRRDEIAFYAPPLGLPSATTPHAWLSFCCEADERPELLNIEDPLLPRVSPKALLSKLSTGEAKRFLLWGLLRVMKTYTILDEPYEHLSPAAKLHLTNILQERAQTGVVIVATNQLLPQMQSNLVVVS